MPNTYYYTSRSTNYSNQTSYSTSRSTTSSESRSTSYSTSRNTAYTTSWTTYYNTSRSTSRSTSYSTSRSTSYTTSYSTSWSTSYTSSYSVSTNRSTSTTTTTTYTTSYDQSTSHSTTLYTNTQRSTTKTTSTTFNTSFNTTYPSTTITTNTNTERNTTFYSPNARKHFFAKTYSGTGAINAITGVGFKPDMVWIKNRDGVENHYLVDSLRGKNGSTVFENVYPNLTNAQANDNAVTSLDSDGFTLAASGNGNVSGQNNVAWCFKAGGEPTSSTPYMVDGTGYSTLAASPFADDGDLDLHEASINKKLGFGIYRFNPSVTSGETNSFDHGLDKTPELVITKSVSHTYNWWTWTNKIDGSWDYLRLNGTHAKTNDTYTTGAFADSTKMRWAYTFMGVSSEHVAYAFHSVDGISKIGSYTGASGKEVTGLGFQPSFLMIKRTDASGNSWLMVDNQRTESNGNLSELFADTQSKEGGTGYDIDLDADGFTLNTTTSNANSVGATYIYLAIA